MRLRLAWAIYSKLQVNLGYSVSCCLKKNKKKKKDNDYFVLDALYFLAFMYVVGFRLILKRLIIFTCVVNLGGLEKGVKSGGAGVIGSCAPPWECEKLDCGPLQEQSVLPRIFAAPLLMFS